VSTDRPKQANSNTRKRVYALSRMLLALYKCDETVNFCDFRCATTSPITVFINVVFYIYNINNRIN